MQTVAICGVGLIGGSFGLALKQSGFNGRILGVSSPATLERALAVGAIDEASALPDAARQADLIYLAQPISRILTIFEELNPHVRPECLVTDAGSTKAAIVTAAREKLTSCAFLGGHPLAGKESRGVEAAEAGLFRNRTYILTPEHSGLGSTPAESVLLGFLRAIGADPILNMSAEEHDKVIALTSHLPQIASTVLALTLSNGELSSNHEKAAGPGLMDMTRLALSPWEIWKDIFLTNGPSIEDALTVYIDKLLKFRDNLTTSRLKEEFDHAVQTASRFRRK